MLHRESLRVGLRLFATLLARLAADGEGQRAETPFGDLTLAVAAGSVHARVQAPQGFINLSHRLRAHLQQRELETMLDICVGVFEVVADLTRSVGTTVAKPALDVILHGASPVTQHLPQVRLPPRRVSHVHLQRWSMR
jgi:hypothetical protein